MTALFVKFNKRLYITKSGLYWKSSKMKLCPFFWLVAVPFGLMIGGSVSLGTGYYPEIGVKPYKAVKMEVSRWKSDTYVENPHDSNRRYEAEWVQLILQDPNHPSHQCKPVYKDLSSGDVKKLLAEYPVGKEVTVLTPPSNKDFHQRGNCHILTRRDKYSAIAGIALLCIAAIVPTVMLLCAICRAILLCWEKTSLCMDRCRANQDKVPVEKTVELSAV